MKLKEFMDRLCHSVAAFLSRTDYYEAPRFSIFDNVFFHEYRVSKSEVITVGFHQRKNSNEINILLFTSSITEIKKNIKDVVSRVPGVKQFNPIVFTMDESKKHPFRMHPDRGSFIDCTLLDGKFGKVFRLVIKIGNEMLSLQHPLAPPASAVVAAN